MAELGAEAEVVAEVVDQWIPGAGVDVVGAGHDDTGVGVHGEDLGFDDEEGAAGGGVDPAGPGLHL